MCHYKVEYKAVNGKLNFEHLNKTDNFNNLNKGHKVGCFKNLLSGSKSEQFVPY